MAVYDVRPQRDSLLADTSTLSLFPPELLRVIQEGATSWTSFSSSSSPSPSSSSASVAVPTRPQTNLPASFLDAISQAALLPRLTGPLFVHFEPLFADICARWLIHARRGSQDDAIIASFARVLPLAPNLSVLLDRYLEESRSSSRRDSGSELSLQSLVLSLAEPTAEPAARPSEPELIRILLALWRLLHVDQAAYVQLVPPELQQLFRHSHPVVRYLAIRVFCAAHAAADAKLESLLGQFVSEGESLVADWDGVSADYTFLSLHEHRRCEDWHRKVLASQGNGKAAHGGQVTEPLSTLTADDGQVTEPLSFASPSTPLLLPLTPLVAAWGRSVVPRPLGPVENGQSSGGNGGGGSLLVQTATTVRNLESLAQCLRRPEPVLLRGLPGAGKTLLVREAARELGMDRSLVTLHLNEQTDAKTLIGLYTTGAKPGSFEWRPGVLTVAVQEGRWVLIEDLDRAPTEVMSTILPLMERRELLIPSRRETIKAARNFRIFATVRTARGLHGQETARSLLGERLWQPLAVQPLAPAELEQVVRESFPSLQALVPDILAVFGQITAAATATTGQAGWAAMDRPATLRDLLKWCRRIEHVQSRQRPQTEATMTETMLISIFLDAVDCFAGSAKDARARSHVGQVIAQALRIPPEVAKHTLTAHEPVLQDGEKQLTVGRVSLRKARRATAKAGQAKRPFATTAHARRLLEQIAVAVDVQEPLLLVGETGIGKTTVVQQLADSMGQKLVAVNLSQQSEVGDLLGGFKPVNVRSLAMPLKEEFEDLFAATGISREKNEKYLKRISSSLARGKWQDVCRLWQQAPRMFAQMVEQLEAKQRRPPKANTAEDGQPAKRRKTDSSRLRALLDLRPRWEALADKLAQFAVQVANGPGSAFAFAFVEGKIVQAARHGDWLLLDEINLASADTLESIADLLASGPGDRPSILLSETGEIDKVEAHPNFRVFGAMNPATDVGKRDLPIGLRSRFTELYVGSPDGSVQDLVPIIKTYLRGAAAAAKATDRVVERVARLYLAIKALAAERRLVDGADEVPHYSLRTLTRVLRYVDDVAPLYGLERALVEGFSMGFLTLLSQASERLVAPLIVQHIWGEERRQPLRQLLAQPPRMPSDGRPYVRFTSSEGDRQYWLLQGTEAVQERADYIRTAYVERNLLNLVRATSTRRFPVLIQGPTSAGKTSMIEFLAHYSGHRFVRINNHEHTDLQEYLGTYVSGAADGQLRFQEGVLVQAMRQGHWIVLDELNLAPTDVLEALNRLLDDNRELLVPETQEVVRPHPGFMLFATQNPAGLYGGRKALSRAFRNRFLELHFDDIPESELQHILQMRCRNTAPSDCARMVTVYQELTRLRQTSRVFEQKNSFATLRDLFRWALREAADRGEIAAHGFMLLAERVRDAEERLAVKSVIEGVFKTEIDVERLYGGLPGVATSQDGGSPVVWTQAMRRLFVLVTTALRNHEPVLLVGETGCGKTTVCQLAAEAAGRALHVVNAHQNTETGDLIGSQRPVRNRGAAVAALREDLARCGLVSDEDDEADSDTAVQALLARYGELDAEARARLPAELVERMGRNAARSQALFEWTDGSLVQAMKTGAYFLLDEISLADDSVLERLNSVLEPQRTLLLAEKGGSGAEATVVAQEGFEFLATMNPGGDFGKKELSPALRNRFTEIWVPALGEADRGDMEAIVAAALGGGEDGEPKRQALAAPMVSFAAWFGQRFRAAAAAATPFSVRDMLVWARFVQKCAATMTAEAAFVHGAATVFVDTLGANPGSTSAVATEAEAMQVQREACLAKLEALLGGTAAAAAATAAYRAEPTLRATETQLWVGDFGLARAAEGQLDGGFAFEAPTTRRNLLRVVRALQLDDKPILLEGNPGVGKTALVGALAQACGRPLTRINLSDQTDLMDLFGTDVPVEGAAAGRFAWRDAPFLQAMQRGEWVLLDEMNLASQAVLEGLNACLDHRGEVYVAELDQTFRRHGDFRLFAAQNPHQQGGGRKGLPASFVNRFVVVYAEVFAATDQLLIAQRRFPGTSAAAVASVTGLVAALDREVLDRRTFGLQGGPWEFNLRDTLRWLEVAEGGVAEEAEEAEEAKEAKDRGPGTMTSCVADFFDMAVRQRFRTERDRLEATRLFGAAFGDAASAPHSRYHTVSVQTAQVGVARLRRDRVLQATPSVPGWQAASRLGELESLLLCVQHNLPCILVGASGTGKSALLQHVAALAGKELVVFSLSADVDAMDLVGGFEQADPVRHVFASLADVREHLGRFLLEDSGHDKGDEREAASIAAAALMRLLRAPTASDESGRQAYFDRVTAAVARLATCLPAAETEVRQKLAGALETAWHRLQQPLTLAEPRFEWLDSVLVHAAQAGHWLVLDNANLCSASVLDRLNSLLERPRGFLSINEHSSPDGSPRVVPLHAEFRVFLTADPRHGELSRAMRNRSVEIFLGGGEAGTDALCPAPYHARITPVEARMQRYRDVVQHCLPLEAKEETAKTAKEETAKEETAKEETAKEETAKEETAKEETAKEETTAWLDNLSLADSGLLVRFAEAVQSGSFAGTPDSRARAALLDELRALAALLAADEAQPLREAVLQHYRAAISGSDVGDQPLHPLQNAALVHRMPAPADAFWPLGAAFELYGTAWRAREALQAQQTHALAHLSRLAALDRLQRSALSGHVAKVARDSTAAVWAFLAEVVQATMRVAMGGAMAADACAAGERKRFLLHMVWHFWRRTYALAVQTTFDEAGFQAHLRHGRQLLGAAGSGNEQGGDSPWTTFADTVARRLESDFADGFRLTTGLSLETLWPLLRPQPIAEAAALDQVVAMERLAARFDRLKWRMAASTSTAAASPVAEVGRVVTALAEAYRVLRVDGIDAAALVAVLAGEMAALEAVLDETPALGVGEAVLDKTPALEAGEAEAADSAGPLLADVFEGLRQLHVLHGVGGLSLTPSDVLGTTVLSDLPTLVELRRQSALGLAGRLQTMDYLLAQTAADAEDATRLLPPWSGALSGRLLRQCDAAATGSSLASLRSLEVELPLAGRVLARSARLLLADPLSCLGDLLWEMMVGLVEGLDDGHSSEGKDLLQTLLDQALRHPQIRQVDIAEQGLVLDGRDAVRVVWGEEAVPLDLVARADWMAVMEAHFLPATLALAASRGPPCLVSRHALLAVAWVQFAIGCIQLYTPDKVMDPYLKWQTEADFHASLQASLKERAAALAEFERVFDGEDHDNDRPSASLRLRLARQDVVTAAALAEHQLRQHQAVTRIFRPSSAAELPRLQKEVFSPVLDLTVKDGLGAAHYGMVAAAAQSDTSGSLHLLQDNSAASGPLRLLQANTARLVERLLAPHFIVYQDLAVPLANLLRCLQLGLSLSEVAVEEAQAQSQGVDKAARSRAWLGVTPLLGGRLSTMDHVPATRSWEYLLLGGVRAAVEGKATGSEATGGGKATGSEATGSEATGSEATGSGGASFSSQLPPLPDAFHFFFTEWCKKRDADSRAEEAKNSLYRFRGSFDDEQETDEAEFAQLFPTWEDEESASNAAHLAPNLSTSTATTSTWDLSADVAKIHRDIVDPTRLPADAILDFCRTMARKAAKEAGGGGPLHMNGTLLPATMLVLDERLTSTLAVPATSADSSRRPATAYNFYSDPNLPEARKLVALVHDVRGRFRRLQRVDEIGHLQPLADVVAATDRVLELGFAEPLARVLPRVEKLHEFVYEWQFRGHAGRQYTAPTSALYDRLTATLISWRKLELATWSRLFDTEADKCRQDAASWWFVAYQAAVAGPLSILEAGGQVGKDEAGAGITPPVSTDAGITPPVSTDASITPTASTDAGITPSVSTEDALAYHAEQLLEQLAAYLSASIVGQFSARLDLLRQILRHLELLLPARPALAVIHRALCSLIAFYGRYEPLAAQALQRGRAGLQKTMNDVLLLASWRDTNIDALRESARRSHQKLFRIVRKFRAVLGQPMGPLIEQGLPAEDKTAEEAPFFAREPDPLPSLVTENAMAAAVVLRQLVPAWGDDAHTRRLSSVDRIVTIMGRAGHFASSADHFASSAGLHPSTVASSSAGLHPSTVASSSAGFHPPSTIAAFVAGLLAAMAALRQETPSTLTDENKAAVQHLKTRKARLLDDTVQAVRQMGFTSNLAGNRLAAQSSLARIFAGYAGAGPLPASLDARPAGFYHFHKLLDLAPRVRDALHAHHADLHRLTARRSVGYLEGLLFVALQQRELLAASARRLDALDQHVALAQALAAAPVAAALVTERPSYDRSLCWLVAMLQAALHLLDVHARLAGDAATGNHNTATSPVQAQLRAWLDTMVRLRRALAASEAAALPPGFAWPATLELRREVELQLQQMNGALDQLMAQHPDLAYLLRQVKLWAVVAPEPEPSAGTEATLPTAPSTEATLPTAPLTDSVLDLSKKLLDGVQKYNKALAGLPASPDDTAWLVTYQAQLAAAAQALHADTVVASLTHSMDLARAVAGAPAEPATALAPALFSLLLPLLQQYAILYRHTLRQLADLHRAVCQLGHRLARALVDVAAQGFCAPADPADADADKNASTGKLEEGTGLGDGQGADDISKDIEPDEDLTELAQTEQPKKDGQEDNDNSIQDEKDAIDMAGEDMAGELGSVAAEDEDDETRDDHPDSDEDQDDMDEEAGDVDDLDPTAVDEKMWDADDAKDADKEQQGNESKRQKNQDADDQGAAADDNTKSQPAGDSQEAAAGEEEKREEKEEKKEEEKEEKEEMKEDKGDEMDADGQEDDDGEMGDDDEQVGPPQELNRQDQNVDENDALELPEDMELEDDEDGSQGDKEFDNLSDLEQDPGDVDAQDTDQDEAKAEDGAVDKHTPDQAMEDTLEKDQAGAPEKEQVDEEDDDEQAEDAMDLDADGEQEDAQDGQEADEAEDGREDDQPPPPQHDNKASQSDQAAPSDVQRGVGPDQDEAAAEDETDQPPQADAPDKNNTAQRDQGDKGQNADEQNTATGGADGKLSQDKEDQPQQQQVDNRADNVDPDAQPFKKLGDVLERWHKTRQDIRQAEETPDQANHNKDSSEQAAQHEFQHLHGEDAPASTQAMGAADDEEARPFDDAMAVEEEEELRPELRKSEDEGEDDKGAGHANQEDGHEDDDTSKEAVEDLQMNDHDDATSKTEQDKDGRAGATMQRGAYEQDDALMEGPKPDDPMEGEDEDEKDEEERVASQLDSTHLDDDDDDDDGDDDDDLGLDAALRQWTAFQTDTHALSLALAAQLRLILAPSLATRLNGGFRTGKRLSIRKIIPYIASGYKRDKIWMRRALPTKRAYQILLCVDDSKSMGGALQEEARPGSSPPTASPGHLALSSPGHLALSSLVMVARALAMLDVGQVGVLGFGARVFAAHALDATAAAGTAPFAAAGQDLQGARALRRFTFQQDRTDVALLLATTIARFRAAREASSSAGGGAASADLWQLAIILSDGLTPSAAHERIRRLLREAAEARIMVVFVILDGAGGRSNPTSASAAASAPHADSVLDLKEAKFVKDPATGLSSVVIERYLDTFPFPYYLIVHHLDDLPAALAGLLRTWFAEVNA